MILCVNKYIPSSSMIVVTHSFFEFKVVVGGHVHNARWFLATQIPFAIFDSLQTSVRTLQASAQAPPKHILSFEQLVSSLHWVFAESYIMIFVLILSNMSKQYYFNCKWDATLKHLFVLTIIIIPSMKCVFNNICMKQRWHDTTRDIKDNDNNNNDTLYISLLLYYGGVDDIFSYYAPFVI